MLALISSRRNDGRMHLRSTLLLLLLVQAPLPGALSRQQRAAADRQALAAPAIPEQPLRPFAGDLARSLIMLAPIPAEELAAAAEAELAALVHAHPRRDLPEALARRFAGLVAALPPRDGDPRWRLELLSAQTPRLGTTGAGIIYCTSGMLARHVQTPALLDLLLARQIGHVRLGHVRRSRQADRLAAVLEPDGDAALWRHALGAGVRASTRWARYAYGPVIEREADYFACQLAALCGREPEALLDHLRSRQSEDAEARQRLRWLLCIRRGRVDEGGALGLRRFDPATGATTPAGANAADDGPAIIAIHGLEGGPDTVGPLLTHLAGKEGFSPTALYAFIWPNDDSLERAATFLGRELARHGLRDSQIAFVAHSAGGLVLRWHLAHTGATCRQAIFAGTPHGGSQLARQAGWLELLQFVGDRQGGLERAMGATLYDGRGQIRHDLQPGSLFLARLDAAVERDFPARVLRGRALSRTRALALRLSLGLVREALAKRLDAMPAAPAAQHLARQALEALRLPPELLRGDGAVSLDAATHPNARRTRTLEHTHVELIRHPQALTQIADWLATPP